MIRMKGFVYDQPATRVIFGVGTLSQLAAEVKRLGAERAMVLSTPEQKTDAEAVAKLLGDASAGVYAEAVMHVPIETARAAREEAKRRDADCYVAVGGGSTVGLGKAIALESGLPIVAVPTTYAGSEMTPIYGITEAGIKKTGKDRKVLPKTVIYDVNLTLTLPVKIAGPSGMNAMAHLIEGLYAQDANPIISLLALEGIRALAQSLPIVVKDPQNLEARSGALYGAWLGGTVLGAVGMAIHHKLCHTLGGSFNLPHAEVHTVILPYATAYNQNAVPAELARAAEALGAESAARGIYDLSVKIGAPVALKDIGMPLDGLDRAAEIATQNPYYNPRPVDYAGVRQLLEDAYYGKRPQ
jgi:maleylacetate reductase